MLFNTVRDCSACLVNPSVTGNLSHCSVVGSRQEGVDSMYVRLNLQLEKNKVQAE